MGAEARDIGKVIGILLATPNCRTATLYLSPTLTLRATRQRRPGKRATRETILFTLGQPNYEARRFIKQCKAAGEPFPVKKVQLKFFPLPRRRRCT